MRKALCTSTGVVEAGCKGSHRHALKRAGMHLDRSRFQRHHRSPLCKLSGRFQDFWERRSERRAA